GDSRKRHGLRFYNFRSTVRDTSVPTGLCPRAASSRCTGNFWILPRSPLALNWRSLAKSQARSPCRSTKRNIATRSLKRVTSRYCPRRWLRSGGGPTRILIWGRVPTGGLTAAVPTGVHGRTAGSRGVTTPEESPSGSANNPFHTVVTAAEISVFVILRQGTRHVLAVQLVKHAQIIVGFRIIGFQRDGLLILLFRLFELVHAGINHAEIH